MNLRTLAAALLAVTACVLWIAAAASATSLTSPEGEIYTGNLVAESEGHVILDNPIATISCASKVEGGVDTHGDNVPVGGEIDLFSFSGCTNSWHVTVAAKGSLEVNDLGGGNGTVTSTGTTVEATRFGVTCRYATSNTTIGTLTGGSPATLDIEGSIPFHSGSGLCGESAVTWTGSYSMATPTSLVVEQIPKFKSTTSPVVFYGAQGAGQHNEWKVDGGNVTTCGTAEYESESTTTPSSEIVLKPYVGLCTPLEYPIEETNKVEMKKCKFELLRPNVSLEGNVAIRCPSGESIRFFGDGWFGDCEVLIGETGNTNLGKAKYTNLGGSPSKFEVKFTLTGITVDRKIDGWLCGLNGTGVVTNGTFTASVTLEGKAGIGVFLG